MPVYAPPRFSGTPNGVRSIAAYGARVSNTAAQNLDAINSALLAGAANGVIEVPVGRFDYGNGAASLAMLTGQTLRGFGRGSRLHYTGSGDAIQGNTAVAASAINNLLIADLFLSGTSAANNGIHWWGVQRGEISSVDIEDFDDLSAFAILMDGSWIRDAGGGTWDLDTKWRCRDNIVSRVGITTQGNGIRFTKHVNDDGSNDGSNFNVVESTYINGFRGYGVDVDNGEHIRVVFCDINGGVGNAGGGHCIGIRLNDSVPYSAANRTDSCYIGHLVGPDDTFWSGLLAANAAIGATNLKVQTVPAGLKVGGTLLVGPYNGTRERVYVTGPRDSAGNAVVTAGAGGTGINILFPLKNAYSTNGGIRTPRAWDMATHIATSNPLPVGDAQVFMGGIGNGSTLAVIDHGQNTWFTRSGSSYIKEQLKQGPGIPIFGHVPTDADFDNPQDGIMGYDTAINRLYIRSGGIWEPT